VCLLGARLHHDDDQHRTRDPYSVLVCRCANEVAGQFELAINAMTAKALGISVSRALLLRADRVIEYVAGTPRTMDTKSAQSPHYRPV
jgi:hypothetical protein